MATVTERATLNLTPRRDVVMWHVVLCVNSDKVPVEVACTTNPLQHSWYAQVVMHKSRSKQCSQQVARYVRRTFGIEEPVTTHNFPRAVEAMIGYACAGGYQHPPDERTPGWGVFQHIAETPISKLLEEVAGGHNAARTRYVVYEVRGTTLPVAPRGVTNKFNSLEGCFRRTPPDVHPNASVVQIARCSTHEEAAKHTGGHPKADLDLLWTRHPPADHVRRHLALVNDEIVWTCDGQRASRKYDNFEGVYFGNRMYTARQMRTLLETGEWVDGRRSR